MNGHAIQHSISNENHNIAISLLDLSFWCYKCESYIENKSILYTYEKALRDIKFGTNYFPSYDKISSEGLDWKLSEEKVFNIKYFNLIEMLIANKCKYFLLNKLKI